MMLPVIFICRPSFSYSLPEYKIAPEESLIPAEDALAKHEARLREMSSSPKLSGIKELARNKSTRVEKARRKTLAEYSNEKAAAGFWKSVVELKKTLIGLHDGNVAPAAIAEADAAAKITIETIYRLNKEFKIFGWAYLQNILVNAGIKKKGFCYHYVGALRDALKNQIFTQYDLHWGTARTGTVRESNALIFTKNGAAFEDGLAIDAWRKAGRPFWTKVRGDRYPWVEGRME